MITDLTRGTRVALARALKYLPLPELEEELVKAVELVRQIRASYPEYQGLSLSEIWWQMGTEVKEKECRKTEHMNSSPTEMAEESSYPCASSTPPAGTETFQVPF